MKIQSIITLAGLLLASTLTQAKKPNILFIFADDFAYDCLAAHGNKQVQTPHLDELSKQSTHFTHAYNSGAWHGAVCVASRTMLQTGYQVWRANKANLAQIIKEKQLFPQLMQEAGYETYFAGKWHVGSNEFCKQSWKNTVHIRPGMPNQTKERYERQFIPGKDTWSPFDKKNKGYWRGGKHWSEVLADDAETFIAKAAKQDKPFMMLLCFNAPHDPRQAPEEYQKKYPYDSITVPANFLKEYPYNMGANKIRDERLAPFPRTPYSIQVNISEYYALITHMDAQMGRILKALQKSGVADNTIVLFSADHGLAVGHHGLLGKQNMYDHSLRVPWLISGPGIPKGKSIDAPIYIQDAMATCLDLAGVKKPDYIDFQSVLPMVHGDMSKARKDMYSCYVNFQRMVSDGKYKLIVYPQVKVELLYDMKNDPLEKENLSANPEYAKVMERMRLKLAEQMKLMKDPVDLKDPIHSFKGQRKRSKGP
jgi:choline-sulfatase